MAHQIKNFIFDIDGTLIDTKEMYMPAMMDVLADHGYPIPKDQQEAAMTKWFGITGADALRDAGVKEADIPVLQKDWNERCQHRMNLIKVIPGIPEVLQKLHDRPDTKLAIATSKRHHEYFSQFADVYYFAKLFDVHILADDTTKHKPDGEPVTAAMKRMGDMDPATTVYVGDTINDGLAAHNAGVKFAGAIYKSAMPDKIADADFPLRHPEDLLTI